VLPGHKEGIELVCHRGVVWLTGNKRGTHWKWECLLIFDAEFPAFGIGEGCQQFCGAAICGEHPMERVFLVWKVKFRLTSIPLDGALQ